MPPNEAACIAIFTRGHGKAVPTLHPFSPQAIEKLPGMQEAMAELSQQDAAVECGASALNWVNSHSIVLR